MKTAFLISYQVIDVCGCLLNLITLHFVYQHFNLKTHVFTLLFLDSFTSTLCSIASLCLDTIFLTKVFEPNLNICFLAYLASYLPVSFGTILTLLISFTRYFLATKAAKNIHPDSKKVTLVVLGIFTAATGSVIVFLFVNFNFANTISLFIYACESQNEGTKSFLPEMVLFLYHPFVCTILSLVTDFQMLRFLKKVIAPSNNEIGPGKTF